MKIYAQEISMRLFPCLNFHEQMETGLGSFPQNNSSVNLPDVGIQRSCFIITFSNLENPWEHSSMNGGILINNPISSKAVASA
jgi:hypothetical protein